MRVSSGPVSIGLGLALCLLAALAHADSPKVRDVALAAGFEEADQEKLLAGEVVATDLPETTDTMLAQAIAVIIKAPVPALAKFILSNDSFRFNEGVLAVGKLDPSAPQGGLAKAVFTPKEKGEVERLLEAEPGDELNLSTNEIKRLHDAAAAGQTTPEQISKVYQGILADRVVAYATKGVASIAPYAREDGTASPAADLKAAAAGAQVLKKYFPDIYDAVVNYPQHGTAGADEAFFWVKRTVEDRPAFILEHRMVWNRGDVLVAMKREYFVGHSYNASFGTGAALPVAEGSLILYGIRTMTDQVAGFMGATRHKIGRSMMRDEITANFEKLAESFGH